MSVDDDYLQRCFNDFSIFAEDVASFVSERLLQPAAVSAKATPERTATFLISHALDQEPDFLRANFQFWVDEDLVFLSDLIIRKLYTPDGECKLTIAGNEKATRTYTTLLRRKHKVGIINCTTVSSFGVSLHWSTLDENQIQLVADRLPPQPWPQGIHKMVAKDLGLSNRKVSQAIQILITRGVFRVQSDGVVLDGKSVDPDVIAS